MSSYLREFSRIIFVGLLSFAVGKVLNSVEVELGTMRTEEGVNYNEYYESLASGGLVTEQQFEKMKQLNDAYIESTQSPDVQRRVTFNLLVLRPAVILFVGGLYFFLARFINHKNTPHYLFYSLVVFSAIAVSGVFSALLISILFYLGCKRALHLRA
ncbi:hypothetical protein [Aliagarivorans marinus]|uniref:hypothetical protein n=1 Tax=Aliagarivorans marinus TaxID=561965 RepID=UPI00047DA062|nr:hypothetical protein [Aliagarivorans marinus]